MSVQKNICNFRYLSDVMCRDKQKSWEGPPIRKRISVSKSRCWPMRRSMPCPHLCPNPPNREFSSRLFSRVGEGNPLYDMRNFIVVKVAIQSLPGIAVSHLHRCSLRRGWHATKRNNSVTHRRAPNASRVASGATALPFAYWVESDRSEVPQDFHKSQQRPPDRQLPQPHIRVLAG